MKFAVDDIVEYQFERMVMPRVGRVLEVTENGLYVLDRRTIEYLPLAVAYVKPFYVEDRDEVFAAFMPAALQQLAAFKAKTAAKMEEMTDYKLLEGIPCKRSKATTQTGSQKSSSRRTKCSKP